MKNCNGKPFLWHLFDSVSKQGITNFFLLTGHLSNLIYEYFQDGKKFGWEINYCEDEYNFDDGSKLFYAKEKLNETFYLLYSDYFSLIDLNLLYKCHVSNKTPITTSIFNSKSTNFAVNENELANNNVDIGYMIIDRNYFFKTFNYFKFDMLEILKDYVKNNLLGTYLQRDSYYNLSDINEWKKTENYLKPKKIILIDRDGVINKKSNKSRYVEKWENFIFRKTTVRAMKRLCDLGVSFIVLTNQAGINRGVINLSDLNTIHRNMVKELKFHGVNILDVFYCPHRPNENCSCRKPKSGMFYQASRKWLLRLDKTLYIGDDPKDMKAAQNAGTWGIFLGLKNKLVYKNPRVKKICVDLNYAVKTINCFFNNNNI